MTLAEARAASGYKLEYDQGCLTDFPLLRDVVGWSYGDNDLLRFVDAQGKPLVEFSEVESGMYEAPTQGYGVLFLQNPTAAGEPPVQPDKVAGDWAITRGGPRPLCMITLTMTPAADEGYAVVVKPNCDAGDRAAQLQSLEDRSRRADAVAGARQSLAFRAGRREQLGAGAGKRQSVSAGAAVAASRRAHVT